MRYPGVYSSSMSVRCCPMWVSSYCLSLSDAYCWWAFVMGCVCSLSFVSVVISVQSVLLCACTCLSSRRVCAFYFISVVFGGSVTGAQTCLVIVAWHCIGNCHLALIFHCWLYRCWLYIRSLVWSHVRHLYSLVNVSYLCRFL